jgi:hypothetical protein
MKISDKPLADWSLEMHKALTEFLDTFSGIETAEFSRLQERETYRRIASLMAKIGETDK